MRVSSSRTAVSDRLRAQKRAACRRSRSPPSRATTRVLVPTIPGRCRRALDGSCTMCCRQFQTSVNSAIVFVPVLFVLLCSRSRGILSHENLELPTDANCCERTRARDSGTIVDRAAHLRVQRVYHVNDPSAGSPTETLLRLLLPLNDQVWSSSRQHRQMPRHCRAPVRRPH